jgi:hypothetical protein
MGMDGFKSFRGCVLGFNEQDDRNVQLHPYHHMAQLPCTDAAAPAASMAIKLQMRARRLVPKRYHVPTEQHACGNVHTLHN